MLCIHGIMYKCNYTFIKQTTYPMKVVGSCVPSFWEIRCGMSVVPMISIMDPKFVSHLVVYYGET